MGGCGVLKELILNFLLMRGCGGLERTDFKQFLLWEGVVVLKELIFLLWEQWCLFLLWEGVVVLKELILNSFYFERVWWS